MQAIHWHVSRRTVLKQAGRQQLHSLVHLARDSQAASPNNLFKRGKARIAVLQAPFCACPLGLGRERLPLANCKGHIVKPPPPPRQPWSGVALDCKFSQWGPCSQTAWQ